MSRVVESFMFGLLLVVGVATAPAASRGDSPPSPAADPSEEPTENADLEDYSTAYGVTPDQARLEWEATDLAGELQVVLIEAEADVFGGLWVEHEPTFAIVVRVLPGGEKAVQEQIDRLGLSEVARIDLGQRTLQQLHKDLASLDTVIPSGVDFAAGVDQSEGRVQVFVQTAEDAILLASVALPESVVVVQQGLPAPAVEIYGGLSLSNGCTTGFNVEQTNGSLQGVSTAGHCSDTTSYNGTNLPWQDGRHSGRVDAQWHTTPGFTDPNKIRVTSSGTTRNVTSRKPLDQMVEGENVCKYGRATLYDCGEIDIVPFDPGDQCVPSSGATYVYVVPNPNAGDMAAGGDSGGPVFHNNPAKAYGMIVCHSPDDDNMTFMPQNFLPDIGVQVDITTP